MLNITVTGRFPPFRNDRFPLSGKDHDILREAVQTLRGVLVSKETEDKLSRIAGDDTKLAGGETPLTGPAK